MNTLTRLVIAVLLAAAAAGASAHGRVHFGVHVGPYWGPWWVVPPPIYYSQPIVVEREAPIVIDQTVAPIDYWYYCRPANAYYPYVKDCPAAWERVPAKPAAQ
jgi:hypothetical protein